MADSFRPNVGDRVILYPLTGGVEGQPAENPGLWGEYATVAEHHDWGAIVHLVTGGQYRASWGDMWQPPQLNGKPPTAKGLHPPVPSVSQARDSGYTGSCCTKCGSVRMRWAGHCQICDDCHDSSECA